MNEISKQIIELGKLIGKKVYVKRFNEFGYYYDDYVIGTTFKTENFEKYTNGIVDKKYKLVDISYREKFGGYYLVTFQYL